MNDTRTTQPRSANALAPAAPRRIEATMTAEDMAEWIARADEQTALEDRTRPTSLLRALFREVRAFLKEGATDLLIYPDAAVFGTDRRTGAIWIYGSRAGDLDLSVPLRTRLKGDHVEVVPAGDQFDLTVGGRTTRCPRATQVRQSPPAIPDATFSLSANRHQLASALQGDPEEQVTIRCSGALRQLSVGRRTVPLMPQIPGEPAAAPFAGRARRRQLCAALTAGKHDCPTFEIRQSGGAGLSLITHTLQTIDGSRGMVHRLVVLRSAEGDL
jgi:hypothetical protein